MGDRNVETQGIRDDLCSDLSIPENFKHLFDENANLIDKEIVN